MKILVTVGSSPFESLIRAVDLVAIKLPEHHFIFQISDGIYKPRSGKFFSFSDSFSSYIDNADIIITHAGAGTVFELLEKQKKCIVAPNFERVDKHQSDLTTYIEENTLAIVCSNLSYISTSIENVIKFEAKPYAKKSFFLTKELINLFQP